MTVPIKYRISSVAAKPVADSVKGVPLTSLEIDGNFRSLKDNIELSLDNALPMANYTALRDYSGTGTATTVRITTPGIAGFFSRRGTTGLTDNGGTVIIDAGGRAWERVFDGAVNVKWFGADPTGVLSSSSAIVAAQNYLASIGGGNLVFPPGQFRVTTPITMKPGITYCGPMKAGLSNYNPNRSRIFSNTGNIFVNSVDTITEVCFRDLFIESETGGGHIFDWSAAGVTAKIEMDGVCLAQRNAAQCVVYGAASGGVFSIWMHDFEFVYVPSCVYAPIWINAPTVNSIVVENFWSTSNGESALGNPAIMIESTNPYGAAFNVAVRQGVFELPGSGCVRLLSCTNSVIEECTAYDLSITPGYYMFSVDKGAGPASSNIEINSCRSTFGTVDKPDLLINTSVAAQGSFKISNSTFAYTTGVIANGAYTEVSNSNLGIVTNLAYTCINNGPTENLRFASTLATSADVAFWNGYPGNRDGNLNITVNGAHSGSISKEGAFSWGQSYMLPDGTMNAGKHVYPGTIEGGAQDVTGILAGVGAPATGGNPGDFYLRSDGGVMTTIYQNRAGVWVGIV